MSNKKRKYTSILATESHFPITSMEQFRNWGQEQMGLFLNGKEIGSGSLKRVRYVPSKKRTCLQTESTGLNRGFRRKGHGIHLYIHLIKHAKKCGAERIYSSQTLNKFSRRMWAEKLPKLFNVVPVIKKRCSECNRPCKTLPAKGYYIQFKGK